LTIAAQTAARHDSPHTRHQCLIYEGAPSQYLSDVAQTIIDKLNANHRCLYLNSPAMVAGMRSRLVASGLDLPKFLERRDLILSSDQGHLINGKFDVDEMIAMLADAVQNALTDGYAGLWATGDMSWEFGSEKNLEKLREYEQRLEELMRKTPALSGICQYHRDTLPPYAIETATQTHRTLYLNSSLSRLNPDYGSA